MMMMMLIIAIRPSLPPLLLVPSHGRWDQVDLFKSNGWTGRIRMEGWEAVRTIVGVMRRIPSLRFPSETSNKTRECV